MSDLEQLTQLIFDEAIIELTKDRISVQDPMKAYSLTSKFDEIENDNGFINSLDSFNFFEYT